MKFGVSVAFGILSVLLAIGTCSGQCPDCWMQFQGSCYLFSSQDLTFLEAERYCRSRGATLARIDNAREDEFLQSHSALFKDATRWIGITDAAREGSWKFVDGGKPRYINFPPGEPNNVIKKKGARRNGENCGVLYVKTGYQWNDGACLSLHRPICEQPIGPCH